MEKNWNYWSPIFFYLPCLEALYQLNYIQNENKSIKFKKNFFLNQIKTGTTERFFTPAGSDLMPFSEKVFSLHHLMVLRTLQSGGNACDHTELEQPIIKLRTPKKPTLQGSNN